MSSVHAGMVQTGYAKSQKNYQFDASGQDGTMVLHTELAPNDQVMVVHNDGIVIFPHNPPSSRVSHKSTSEFLSGTFTDVTDIPSWANRLTIILSDVVSSSATPFLIQVGTSAGILASNYDSVSASTSAPCGTTGSGARATNGTIIQNTASTTHLNGTMVYTRISADHWISSGFFTPTQVYKTITCAGKVSPYGTINKIRITTNSTATFSSGRIIVLSEGWQSVSE